MEFQGVTINLEYGVYDRIRKTAERKGLTIEEVIRCELGNIFCDYGDVIGAPGLKSIRQEERKLIGEWLNNIDHRIYLLADIDLWGNLVNNLMHGESPRETE